MKKFMYWLMGDTAGRVVEMSWNWLWGISEEPDEALSELIQEYERAKQEYEGKLREVQQCERQAIAFLHDGNDAAARSARLKASQVEQLLPQLEEQVRQAEKLIMERVQQSQHHGQSAIEEQKIEKPTKKDLSEVGEALVVKAKIPVQNNVPNASQL